MVELNVLFTPPLPEGPVLGLVNRTPKKGFLFDVLILLDSRVVCSSLQSSERPASSNFCPRKASLGIVLWVPSKMSAHHRAPHSDHLPLALALTDGFVAKDQQLPLPFRWPPLKVMVLIGGAFGRCSGHKGR